MARNIEKEQEQILNGNRYLVNATESTGVFIRDVDKLTHQYRNLRLSVFNQFKNYFVDPVSRDELRSYIDEQFVRLVKEYDINSPVDFPGYIKSKLANRVKHTYIKKELRDRHRVFVTRGDFEVETLMDNSPAYDVELDYYAALESALEGVTLNEVEKLVLFCLLQEMSNSEIEKYIERNHPQRLPFHQLRDIIRKVQTLLKTRLNDAIQDGDRLY